MSLPLSLAEKGTVLFFRVEEIRERRNSTISICYKKRLILYLAGGENSKNRTVPFSDALRSI